MDDKLETIKYYNQNAEEYYQQTVDVDLSSLYKKFLYYLNLGDHILDLGCGSGRDSLYFLEAGYQVTAVDGAENLAQLAENLIGQSVLNLRFKELDFKDEFAGVWACASLLHISKSEMKKVFVKIRKALKKDGILYLSFKYGEEECFCDGRFFNYYTEKSFTELIAKVSGLEIIELWKTIDAKENRKDTFWLNVLIIKE